MHIKCPYCETPYDIDGSLLPEGDIKVKCRVCPNIFILNKNSGAAKNESIPPALNNEFQPPPQGDKPLFNDKPPVKEPVIEAPVSDKPVSEEPVEKTAAEELAAKEPAANDFMQSIMSEINSAVAEETRKHGDNSYAGHRKTDAGPGGKTKTTPFQTAILIILIAVFLVAAASALVHYNIIDMPFLPSNLLSLLRLV